MNTKIEITDEMVERAYQAYYTHGSLSIKPGYRVAMRRALEAAMNPPPVACKNCGKPRIKHIVNWSALDPGPVCPGYVFEPVA